MSNPDTKDQQNTLKKNDEKSLRFISGHSTLEHDDIEYEYYETDSSEKELNDNKRQNVVLVTDAQTIRFLNAVAADPYDDGESVYFPDEVFEPYQYQRDEEEDRLQRFLNKVKPYSFVLQNISVYGFYKWCVKNDVHQFLRDTWPRMLREKFYDEAAQDALKEPQED
ncbi:hypothetical protein PS15p_206849 [Mucor circinelloides]